jgi:DNA-binding transcriptional LysR family regulator
VQQSPSAAFHTNLKSLECFRAIINLGSATAAAQYLQMTQPAVSRLLRVLEESTGFELFHRSKGRLIPTDEALVFYREVDIALQSIERVSEFARNLRNTDFGELRIVAPPSFAEGILPGLLSDFIENLPNVRVSLNSESVEVAKDMVALRAVDCGFIKLPAEHADLDCKTLLSSGTVAVLPRGHRLASKREIKVSDLDGEQLILLGKGRASRQLIDEAFADAGVRMRVRIEAHTVGAACAFARHGTGIAIINEMLGTLFADEQLEFRRFVPNVLHEYAFMTSRDAPMTRITQRFYEHCVEHFARHADDYRLATPVAATRAG